LVFILQKVILRLILTGVGWGEVGWCVEGKRGMEDESVLADFMPGDSPSPTFLHYAFSNLQ
jgi:hypothetical protein